MNAPEWLELATVLSGHETAIAMFGGSSGIRDQGLLESALARPENLFAYGEPTLFELAAAYAWGIVRNHPFLDGNERTAFIAAGAFLELNGWELTASQSDAADAMWKLATGDLAEAEFAAWLARNCQSA